MSKMNLNLTKRKSLDQMRAEDRASVEDTEVYSTGTDSSGSDIEPSKEEPKMGTSYPAMFERMLRWAAAYLHLSPVIKLAYYGITLYLFSMVHKHDHIPHLEALTGRHSILNQWFVKKGWGITLAAYVVCQLICLTLHQRKATSFKRLAAGVLVTTFFYFIWCQVIFPSIEHLTSLCTHKNIRVDHLSKRECVKRMNHVYHSFDISGHSYLLTYCVLVMMEESKGMSYILRLREYLRGRRVSTEEQTNGLQQQPQWTCPAWMPPDEKYVQTLQIWFPKIFPLASLSFIILTMLAILWDFMLIVTTVYYHTFIEKILGSSLAVGMWYLVYHKVFKGMEKWQVFMT